MTHIHPTIVAGLSPTRPLHARAWGWLKRASAQVAAWLAAHRDARAAAALYAELSKLSDAELHRRGLSHGDLHRQVGSLFHR